MIALYHFITFITLLHLSLYRFYRIYHLITFLMKKPSLLPVIIGTGFGSGFSPFAPGTAGALLATLIWFGLSYLVSSACLLWLTVALILVFTLAGIWAANRLEASWGEDPSRVVVDEMVGVWIALLAAPAGHVWYALGAFVKGEQKLFYRAIAILPYEEVNIISPHFYILTPNLSIYILSDKTDNVKERFAVKRYFTKKRSEPCAI